jgi:hypothetical protein
VDQLKQAIDGCKRSDFHQGRPPASKDGKVFDDLTLICRNGENVERFGSLLTQAVVKATPLPRFKSRTERNEDEAREFLADKRRPS